MPLIRIAVILLTTYGYTYAANLISIDTDSKKQGWHIELQRISLNFSSTQINNQDLYASFANSKVSGDSQLILQGYVKFLLDYYANRFVIFNSLLSEYGQTIVYLKNSTRLSNKTLDRVLLSIGYTQRVWKIQRFGGGEIGPFVQLNYQTEFTPSIPLPYRKKILRFNAGFRLFDGVYIQNLSLNLFGEEDFSNIKQPVESLGIETSISLKKNIREGVDFTSSLNYRQYIANNYPNERDPQLDLEFNMRLDTVIWNNLTISPYISLYLLKGRYIKEVGSNFFIGVSLGYGKVFKDAKLLKPQENET